MLGVQRNRLAQRLEEFVVRCRVCGERFHLALVADRLEAEQPRDDRIEMAEAELIEDSCSEDVRRDEPVEPITLGTTDRSDGWGGTHFLEPSFATNKRF